MNKPLDITIAHTRSFPASTFSPFLDIISNDQLNIQVEERDDDGIYAGIEWLLPTAVIVYLGKSYFDGFLNEMGKDHYLLLKSGFLKLWDKLLGPNSPQVKILSSSESKMDKAQTYSLTYSIYADARNGYRFKLLIQREVSLSQYDAIIDAFLVFLVMYHGQLLDKKVIEYLDNMITHNKTILIAYNFETEEVELVNPIPEKLQNNK